MSNNNLPETSFGVTSQPTAATQTMTCQKQVLALRHSQQMELKQQFARNEFWCNIIAGR